MRIGIIKPKRSISNETKNLLFQAEQEIAKMLLNKLEHFETTFERASQMAGFILATLPNNLSDYFSRKLKY